MDPSFNHLLTFSKLQGAGNDFIFLNAPSHNLDAYFAYLRPYVSKLCDRNFGIGADGVIVLSSTESVDDIDFRMTIFNADGSDEPMCGNGIRCAVKWAIESGIVKRDKNPVKVMTRAGVKEV